MTNDEFHGHLMAALQGPHAQAIVARIIEVTLVGAASDPDLVTQVLDALETALDV